VTDECLHVFVAPAAEEGCQAGTVLASSIMQQQEELGLRQRSAAEAQRWRDAQPESETDSEEEEDEEGQKREAQAGGTQRQPQWGALPAAQQAGGEGGGAEDAAEQGGQDDGGSGEGGQAFTLISEEEQADNAAAFLDLMKQRFLAGQEEGVDYAAIDAGGCWRAAAGVSRGAHGCRMWPQGLSRVACSAHRGLSRPPLTPSHNNKPLPLQTLSWTTTGRRRRDGTPRTSTLGTSEWSSAPPPSRTAVLLCGTPCKDKEPEHKPNLCGFPSYYKRPTYMVQGYMDSSRQHGPSISADHSAE
jgi:hypothetical protein